MGRRVPPLLPRAPARRPMSLSRSAGGRRASIQATERPDRVEQRNTKPVLPSTNQIVPFENCFAYSVARQSVFRRWLDALALRRQGSRHDHRFLQLFSDPNVELSTIVQYYKQYSDRTNCPSTSCSKKAPRSTEGESKGTAYLGGRVAIEAAKLGLKVELSLCSNYSSYPTTTAIFLFT